MILRWARDHHIFRPNELIASLPEPVQVNESNNQTKVEKDCPRVLVMILPWDDSSPTDYITLGDCS